MEMNRETAIAEDFHDFMLELRAAEAQLDVEPGVAQYVELAREAAFRSGWAAGQSWQEHHDAEAPTVRVRALSTVRALASVGERAWVQPLAIVEHLQTGERFVDPMFTIVRERSTRCCVQLVVTHAGLVASGPTDRHRLSADIDRERLRPLVDFEAIAG